MEQKKSPKDSLVLIFLSLIALIAIVFFVIRLWFPDLIKKEEDVIVNTTEEDTYDEGNIPKISVEELKEKFVNHKDFVLIDVQETEDFIQASIPTAISMPLSEIEQRYEELPKNKEIIASDAGGNCQECSRAVEILVDSGYVDAKKLDGGVNAWSNAGYPVIRGNEVTFQNINSDTLLDMVDADENIVVVDVRELEEYNQGHIAGAVHIPFTGLFDNIKDIPRDKKIIVYDESGNRSKIAIKQFIMQGYVEVINLLNGYKDWLENNYPVEK